MWLGPLVPWRRFALDTSWSPPEVVRELGLLLNEEDASDVHTLFAVASPPAADAFRMARRRGDVAIVLSGRAQPLANGSRVHLTLRLTASAMVVLLAVGPMLTLLSLGVTMAALLRHEGIMLLIWLGPLAMWPGVARPFLKELHEVEALVRARVPPPRPAGAGPFR